MKRSNAILYWTLIWLMCLCTFGCGDSNRPNETIKGLQEENKVLREQLTFRENNKTESDSALRKRIEAIEKNKTESEAALHKQIETIEKNKTESEAALRSQIQDLRTAHEDSLTREKELHRSQAAQLEKEIANLRLELGSSQREKIALQEIVDREPRIKEATAARMGTDIWVLALLLGMSLIFILFVVFRYRTASDRLNLLAMQQVSELRRIGGEV